MVFISFGATASFIGNLLLEYSNSLRIIAGLVIIIFSLQLIGILNLNFLNQEKRIYTKNELDYCKNKPNRLAARFAVKEAVMKTLGTGIKGVGWKDIETIRNPGQRPLIKLHNRALAKSKKLGIKNISISISHSKDYAIAFAVAEKTI